MEGDFFGKYRCSKIPRPLRGAMQKRNKNRRSSKLDAYFYFFFAEREGFEPPVPRSTTVFKTAAIDHSAISPMEFPPKSDAKIVYFFIKKKISTIFLSLHNITYPRGDLSYSSLNVPLPFLSIKPYLRL